MHTNAYELTIEDIHLRLSYVVIESSLRAKYYSSIADSCIIKDYEYQKVNYFTLNNGSKQHFIPNILSFQRLPRFLVMFFTPEQAFLGNYSNRYVYKHENLSSLSVWRSGQPLSSCQYSEVVDLSEYDSSDSWYFFNEFRKLLDPDMNVSYERFYYDMFIFCVDLSQIPLRLNTDAVSGLHNLELTTSGSLDLSLCFAQTLRSNMVLSCMGYYNNVIKINASGDILTD